MDFVNNPTCSLADWAGVSGHHWEPSGLASQVSNEKNVFISTSTADFRLAQ